MDRLIDKVEEWAEERNLLTADPRIQFLKTVEEIGEVSEILNKRKNDKTALREEIGDILVTLIILSRQCDLSIKECLMYAYGKIKSRRGKLVDGIFVKEEDL